MKTCDRSCNTSQTESNFCYREPTTGAWYQKNRNHLVQNYDTERMMSPGKISKLLKLGCAVPHKKTAKSFTIFHRLVHHPRRPCQPSFTNLLACFAFRHAISRHASHCNWTEDLTIATSAPPRYFHPAVAYHVFKLDRIGFKKVAKAMIVGGE